MPHYFLYNTKNYFINFFILLSDNKILEYQNKNKINENNIAIGITKKIFSQEPDEGVYSPDSIPGLNQKS